MSTKRQRGPTRDQAIVAALFAHNGTETLIREEGLPREAVEPEPIGFLIALEGLGYTVVPTGLREAAEEVIEHYFTVKGHRETCPCWGNLGAALKRSFPRTQSPS